MDSEDSDSDEKSDESLAELLQEDCQDKSCQLCQLSSQLNTKKTQTGSSDFFLPPIGGGGSGALAKPTESSIQVQTDDGAAEAAQKADTNERKRRAFNPKFSLGADQMETRINKLINEEIQRVAA